MLLKIGREREGGVQPSNFTAQENKKAVDSGVFLGINKDLLQKFADWGKLSVEKDSNNQRKIGLDIKKGDYQFHLELNLDRQTLSVLSFMFSKTAPGGRLSVLTLKDIPVANPIIDHLQGDDYLKYGLQFNILVGQKDYILLLTPAAGACFYPKE